MACFAHRLDQNGKYQINASNKMGTDWAAATKRSLHFENSWNSGGTTLTCFGNAVNTKVCIQALREKR